MIAILDYGIGNIGSIKNMLLKAGAEEIEFADNAEILKRADQIILPGVGAYDTGMKLLNSSGMREELDRQVLSNKKPILGICLGMQMLGKSSEEGVLDGLGYLDFVCKKFKADNKIVKIPHMGWDYVVMNQKHRIISGMEKDTRFYFVHSYYATCANNNDVLLWCDYGIRFAAAVGRENVLGTQFHPEKSHIFGLYLMKNFVNWFLGE